MEFLFTCQNQNCSFPGKDKFKMTIDEESVMDDKNIATVFCPFCKKEMTPSSLTGQAASDARDLPGRVH